MTITELKALAQDLRNERNEFQRKMAIMKLEAQMDTPIGIEMGG